MTFCTVCKKYVKRTQQAIMCDGCEKWTHRKCNTGISVADYKEAVSTKSDIPFRCHMCTTSDLTETDQEATNNRTEIDLQSDITPIGQPVLESTRIGNHSISYCLDQRDAADIILQYTTNVISKLSD
uniref:PHD-type domain-containing protein n=1 Tax=Magallana gigas TaxID=29159 RepID=K1P3Q8_MAGGI